VVVVVVGRVVVVVGVERGGGGTDAAADLLSVKLIRTGTTNTKTPPKKQKKLKDVG